MKEEKDKLRDFMQEVFQDYEVAPEPEIWDRIGKTLSERKRRRIIPWIIWASAASLLLLLALYTGGILNHSESTSLRTAVKETKSDQQVASAKDKAVTKELLQTVSANKAASVTTPSENKTQNRDNNVNAVTAEETERSKQVAVIKGTQYVKPAERLTPGGKTIDGPNPLPVLKQTRQIAKVDLKEKTETVSTGQLLTGINGAYERMVHAVTPKYAGLIRLQRKEIALHQNYIENEPKLGGLAKRELNDRANIRFTGLALTNSSGMIIQASGKEFMSYNSAFASQLTSNMFANSVKVFDNSLLSTLNIGNLFQNNTRNYSPPITFGLNLNLSMEQGLSFETGIQYTRLQSSGSISISSTNAIQFTNSFGYHVDENLYYLGIPFMLNYSFAQLRKSNYYLSGGFSVEKGLIAKYKATPVDKLPGMEPIYSHNAIKGLQYSIFGGIGISYRFISHFELFGQPSMTWYLKTAGKNNTVYSEHPLIFNLRTGIRYTIK